MKSLSICLVMLAMAATALGAREPSCGAVLSANSSTAEQVSLILQQDQVLDFEKIASPKINAAFDSLVFPTNVGPLSMSPRSFLPHAKSLYAPLNRVFRAALDAYSRGLVQNPEEKLQEMNAVLEPMGIRITNFKGARDKIVQLEREEAVHSSVGMAPYLSTHLGLNAYLLMLTAPLDVTNAILRWIGKNPLNEPMLPGLAQLHFQNQSRHGPVLYDPRAVMMVNAVLQFAPDFPNREDNRFLEIGYGTPINLLGVQYYRNASRCVGIDLVTPPERANEVLGKAGIELLSGAFPDSVESFAALRERGPYSVIFSQDTIKKDPPRKEAFKTKANAFTLARSLHELLCESGVVILLNDYQRPNYFSRREVERAGFSIVRWEEPRRLPSVFQGLYGDHIVDKRRGRFNLTVLRRGETQTQDAKGQ